MDNVILAVAVVAVHQFISAVATLFFDRAYMHKVTHLHTWQFFLLAEQLRPLIKRPRNGKQKAEPTCKHDYLH
jgi:hypothetical protein